MVVITAEEKEFLISRFVNKTAPPLTYVFVDPINPITFNDTGSAN